ncbi:MULTISPECIES: thiol:disulfide interchange protein DsbA [unclassified Pseudomonas]|uniref:thiol:disulfide interchange protein DsbA n=1 Tax=unclassified Pseudomonas TaxID=196821 RepID=UPI0004D8F66D|nr:MULTISPECIES: thiol:disulfide interchange protein DsbA [unclassified Pseudomonas]KES23305.1 thiol:disulfide interchange protein [Pseudomonas sp. AAC]OHS11391.1 thiol:disulfide interchange protein [Pseudomonas sp. HMSC75E02]
MRNLIFTAVLAFAGLFGLSAQAAEFESGKQYTELSTPVPVSQPGKIEVVELFWYGCPHCYAFEPIINPWIGKLPADVHFVRIPAMFGGIWNVHGQLFLTLEAMGVEHKVHTAVFEAIHKEGKKLATPEEMADFLAPLGVDKDKFLSTFDSFAIKGQIEKDKKLAMAYQISGVPTMVVNGKYRFDIGSAGGPEKALELADFLIAKERDAAKAAQ